ncbi:small ribosomal subunit protein uS2m-like isoform X2 [Oculina patagonica]
MAALHGLRTVWNISSFRVNTVISSLLAPVTRLRQGCSIHSSARSSQLLDNNQIQRENNSSVAQSHEIKTNDDDPVITPTVENVLEHPDFFEVHKLFTVRDLFNANVHLGHYEGCWEPLMKPYLYGIREHHHIIDLNQTVVHLRLALNVLGHIAYRGGKILFISTHPQFEELTQRTARDCGEYFITRRWRGGTLTNSYMLLGTTKHPDMIVFLHLPSLGKKTQAVTEAAMANIPTIGIVDTDCNPNLIMYPIPGNDDTPSAVELYCDLFRKVVLKAKEVRKAKDEGAKELGEIRLQDEVENQGEDVTNY